MVVWGRGNYNSSSSPVPASFSRFIVDAALSSVCYYVGYTAVNPTSIVNTSVTQFCKFTTTVDHNLSQDTDTTTSALGRNLPGFSWFNSKLTNLHLDMVRTDRENQIHHELAAWDRDIAPDIGGMTHKRIIRVASGFVLSTVVMSIVSGVRSSNGRR